MGKIVILTIICIIVILFVYELGVQSGKSKHTANPPQDTALLPTGSVEGIATGSCHINGVLPDSKCTPGVIDPRVTQDNIYATICVKGYTKTVRPPRTYTDQLKREQIQEYGYSDTNTSDYEEDHLIPLEVGGNPSDPKNLWPQPGRSPNMKDRVETRCHDMVCNGSLPLATAQQEIATNWQTACE